MKPKTAFTRGGGKRQAERHAKRGKRARVGGDPPKLRPAERRCLQDEGGERDQDDQAEIGQRETERQPETRDDARLLEDVASGRSGHSPRRRACDAYCAGW